ncbi:MAG: two-component system, OmpR family, phosphate regulon response regulator PhoB [Solirubrobacteraceae bacterium]|jgi:DNA-binding response OmpR family regulator|nr:two-component system, OmpR family, phosphate regulon response regulator PhoB [Solirubrobacteraceae bacterium]
MNRDRPTILLVEDHRTTCTFLADNLTADGYEILVADCARDAWRLLSTKFPDLALVDLGLPDRDGLELLRDVREGDGGEGHVDRHLPLIVVSGRAGELDRLRGFARGCDDYVVKPFSYPELRARIEALLKRTERKESRGLLRVGPLQIDPLARQAWLHGTSLELSKKEFALLRALAADPTRVFTRDELLRGVWGYSTVGRTRTLDSHAYRLRRKLGESGGRYVVNVWGIGYRLVDGSAEDWDTAC